MTGESEKAFTAGVPQHFDSQEGIDLANEYAGMARADLMMGEYSDFVLANAQYLISRNDLRLISFQQAAKERIRWLSVQVALAATERDTLKARVEELEAVLKLSDKERRQFWLTDLIRSRGYFNRSDLEAAFGISTPQASGDIQVWLAANPDMAVYNKTSKRYERVARAREAGIQP